MVEPEVHAVHQVGQVVHEILVHRAVGRFQAQQVLVARFQRFQFGVEVLVFSLKHAGNNSVVWKTKNSTYSFEIAFRASLITSIAKEIGQKL